MKAEYPDATWAGPARWYTRGRDGKAPRLVVIHYTAGSENRTAAEDGAAYDRRRPDRVSTHFFVDRDSVVQEVALADQAYAAFGKGNRLGVQIELCGTVQSRAQWFDAASLPTLERAADLTAWLCRRYGLEPRRLSLDETRRAWDQFPNGPRGIVGHVDCTYAYGQGDHTDPGTSFPWGDFIDMVRARMGAPAATEGGNDMGFVVHRHVGDANHAGCWWAWSDGLRYKPIVTWPQKLEYERLSGRGELVVSDDQAFAIMAGRLDSEVDPDEVDAARDVTPDDEVSR